MELQALLQTLKRIQKIAGEARVNQQGAFPECMDEKDRTLRLVYLELGELGRGIENTLNSRTTDPSRKTDLNSQLKDPDPTITPIDVSKESVLIPISQ